MERDAHYALVGLISAVLFVGVLVFVVWLARLQFNTQYSIYDVDFKGPVRGLSSGGEVFFNGIKVGEVTKLSLDKSDPNRVRARIRTTADAPVRVDSYATLEPLGITGVNYIQLSAGTPTKPLLRDVTPEGQVPLIHSRRGALEGLLEGGGDVLARSVEALNRVNQLLSDQNIANFDATLSNIKDATALAKNQKQLFADLDKTVKSIDASSQRIAVLSNDADHLLTVDGRQTLTKLDGAIDELKGATADARTLVDSVQGPTANFAATGLPQLTRTIVSLQTAADSVNRLVMEVEQNPRLVLTKPPAKTVEVKP
jgi:phospholipid/cholesterol/gamma-HCH transport system substrate-binding protein